MALKEKRPIVPACRPHQARCGCWEPVGHGVGQHVAVAAPRLLARRTRLAWCHMLPALPREWIAESRSRGEIATPSDSARPGEGHQPISKISSANMVTWGGGGMLYLRVSRIGVEDVGEELARAGDPGNDETMDVVAVDHEEL